MYNQIIARCGKHRSNSDKDFTEESLKQHEQSCRCCLFMSGDGNIKETPAKSSKVTILHHSKYKDYFDDEIPDGAYWALRMENPFI